MVIRIFLCGETLTDVVGCISIGLFCASTGKVDAMVKDNIEVDVKVKCIETGKTQVQIAEEINTTRA